MASSTPPDSFISDSGKSVSGQTSFGQTGFGQASFGRTDFGRTDSVGTVARSARQAPMLDAAREAELARRWRDQGDLNALHQLTGAYLRLVIAIAARYRSYGLAMGDLIQEGSVGLMQAAARFDPDRGVRFSTYATWWIKAAVQQFVLRNWSIVRTGTTSAQKALFFNLRRLRRLIEPEHGALSAAGRAQVAETLGVPVADVADMEMRLGSADRSLNAPIGLDTEDSQDWQDRLADDRPTPDAIFEQESDTARRSAWLHRALQTLQPRERQIISERRLDDDGATLEEMGRRLGVSKERARQIEAAALAKLKAALTRDIPDPVAAGLIDPP